MVEVNPMVVDLSHWDPADDYGAVKKDGIVGVIYKATQGCGYTDPTYVSQQHAAKEAGLLWGAYHFADGSDVDGQVRNFLDFACPDRDELFCLDWEDNPGGTKMSADQAEEWVTKVENELGRPGECVIYGGNTLKESLDADDAFFGARRLWLCQYGTSPSLPLCWDECWLWQFTDGVYGPTPHDVDGIGPCDINSYEGDPSELAAEWASGMAMPQPGPRPPPPDQVTVVVIAPPGVEVKVRQAKLGGVETARKQLQYSRRR
jgi:lysozyme